MAEDQVKVPAALTALEGLVGFALTAVREDYRRYENRLREQDEEFHARISSLSKERVAAANDRAVQVQRAYAGMVAKLDQAKEKNAEAEETIGNLRDAATRQEYLLGLAEKKVEQLERDKRKSLDEVARVKRETEESRDAAQKLRSDLSVLRQAEHQLKQKLNWATTDLHNTRARLDELPLLDELEIQGGAEGSMTVQCKPCRKLFVYDEAPRTVRALVDATKHDCPMRGEADDG